MLHLRRAVTPLCVVLVVLGTVWTETVVGDEAEINTTDTVVRVIDGDTFVGQRLGRVRLADVDAPEVGEPGAQEATDDLRSLVYARFVFLDVDDVHGTDKYGRVVAVVYVEHNATYLLNVNFALLEAGRVSVADFPNEFDPAEWTRYVVRPSGLSTSVQDPNRVVVLSVALILVTASIGILLLFRPPNLFARRGKD